MLSRLVHRRLIWWPTWAGWIVLIALIILPLLTWWFWGETFFARTDRHKADTLIVEGWIGYDGISAAKVEFDQGGYQRIVTVGGFTNNSWGQQQWNYAELAHAQLIRLGVPADRVIAAPAPRSRNQRTFEAAWAARETLESRSLQSASANIFTLSVHTRRSRLVFAKVLPDDTEIGCVAWHPSAYGSEPWWKSSERSGDMIKETVGYVFELLLNSGRTSNSRPRH